MSENINDTKWYCTKEIPKSKKTGLAGIIDIFLLPDEDENRCNTELVYKEKRIFVCPKCGEVYDFDSKEGQYASCLNIPKLDKMLKDAGIHKI